MSDQLIGTRAAVIGGGLMGHGIAQVLAVGGVDVVVHDPSPEALAAVPDRVSDNLAALGEDPRAVERISLEDRLEEAVRDVQWVFEAAPEKLELKQEIFERLDRSAPHEAILATNTSVISVGDIARSARLKHRIVGTHWWNPPFLVPLVEVVQGEDTSRKVVEQTIELLEALGKVPVHVQKDVPGFVGNRLQHALWREAFELVDAGVCDAETIDTVVRSGFGLRLPVMGPMETADLVGLDLTLNIHEYLLPRLSPPSQPAEGLRERVARSDLGMRTGQGFRAWTEAQAEDARHRLRDYLIATASRRVPTGDP